MMNSNYAQPAGLALDTNISTQERSGQTVNAGAGGYAPNTICERFAQRVAEDPNHTAVIGTYETLSREELMTRAAAITKTLPVGAKRVGVAMSHSPQMIATIFAILQAGAAYVPVEPSFPKDRIEYMMENAQVDCIITDDGLTLTDHAQAPHAAAEASGEQVEQHGASSTSPAPTPDSLAYILYTSGTTGKPKGVMVTHSNVCHYVDAFANEFEPQDDDVMMQHSVCSFDIFVEEVFGSLLNGMALAIPSSEDMADIDALMDFVERTDITIISGFPYLLQEMNGLSRIPQSLRLLISGGDILRARYIDKLLASNNAPLIYNTYGPSETTVCASYFRCNGADPLDDGTYPVGKPVRNVQIAVVDDSRHEVAPGEIGEFLITGNGVSQGYVGNPPEQANFIVLPNGEHGYLSGDLGYVLPDGNLAFLHRKDNQVMIDGRRVEPTEVESVLCQCDDVAAGAVRSYVDANDMPYLVGYFVPTHEATDYEETKQRILQQMSDQLAPYMVPEFLVSMRSMPLTPNGKIDTQALPRVWKAVG